MLCGQGHEDNLTNVESAQEFLSNFIENNFKQFLSVESLFKEAAVKCLVTAI